MSMTTILISVKSPLFQPSKKTTGDGLRAPPSILREAREARSVDGGLCGGGIWVDLKAGGFGDEFNWIRKGPGKGRTKAHTAGNSLVRVME